MNELKPEVNIYFEGDNQLKNINCDYLLRDGVITHWEPPNIDNFVEYGDIIVSGNFDFNKITIYFVPTKSNFGQTQNSNLFEIWYIPISETEWYPLDLEDFNFFVNLPLIEKVDEGRYYSEVGICHLWKSSLETIKAKKLRFYFPAGAKITEIEVSKLVKRNPLNIRFNETRSIDDEYKGIEINTTFFDGDFEIKNTTFYNQKVYLEIKVEDKIKRYGNLFVSKILTDVKERITNIYFYDIITKLKNMLIDDKTEIFLNEEISKIIEMLFLEGNIHSDITDIQVIGKIDYYPRLVNIYEELLEILKSSGDVELGFFNNKIYIRSRAKTSPKILTQGTGNTYKSVIKKGIDDLAKIEFNEIFVKNWVLEKFPKYGIFYEANDIVWEQINQDKWKLKVLRGGYIQVKNFIFSSREIQLWYYRIFVKVGRTIFDILRGQQVSIDFKVITSRRELLFSITYFADRNLTMDIRFLNFVDIRPLRGRGSFLCEIRDTEGRIIYTRSFGTYDDGEMKELYVKIYSIQNDLTFSYIITGFGLPSEIRDENNNLIKDGFGYYYDFDTPDAYLYNTFYLEQNDFYYISSLSTNDREVVKVDNGLVKSNVGERIRIYLYHYRLEPINWDLEINPATNNFLKFQVQYNYINFVDRATLTYFRQRDQDFEQGIINLYPKEIKIMKSPEFYTEDIMFNNILINLLNWNKKSEEVIFKDKVPIFIKENIYFTKSKIEYPVYKDDEYQPRVEIEIEGLGTRTYFEGETIDNDLSWVVKYTQNTLSLEITIEPISKNIIRNINRLEIKATIWKDESYKVIEYRNLESIKLYGYKKKQISARYLTNESHATNLAKKYLRFSSLPIELLGDEIYTLLNLDISFLYYGKIYDEIQQKAYLFKIFEYEHYIDIENGIYDTILRGRIIRYEDYSININYWGNQDYWGNNPSKYWGGEYYG